MHKLSAEKIAAVLMEVPGTLRALAQDRDGWRTEALEAKAELAKIAQKNRIAKIASEMETKGLDSSHSMQERLSMLEKKASEGRLDVIEEAINMSPVSRPLGEIIENLPGQAKSDLENYILGELM
jgi:hypothetical protein